jgi:hypothetical protein
MHILAMIVRTESWKTIQPDEDHARFYGKI